MKYFSFAGPKYVYTSKGRRVARLIAAAMLMRCIPLTNSGSDVHQAVRKGLMVIGRYVAA